MEKDHEDGPQGGFMVQTWEGHALLLLTWHWPELDHMVT